MSRRTGPDLRQIADHLPAMIGYVDPQQRYVYVNRRYEECLGAPANAVVGRCVRDLLDEATYAIVQPHLAAALAGERVTFSMEHELLGQGRRHLTVHYLPDVDASGATRGVFTWVTDESERQAVETKLRWNEERYRNLVYAILDAAVDGIITIDDQGRIESINPAAQRMFGYGAAEACGRDISMLMPAPYAAEHAGYLQRYYATGERRIIGIGREVIGLRRDGSTFPIELAVSEVHWDGRRMFAGNVRDVTARKQLEAELLQAQKMEAVGRLAGGIAHDFNNLLMGIIGCLRVAANALPDGHAARALIEDASREAERGSGLTRQLLTFSRKRQIDPKPIDLNAIVDSARKMIGHLLGEDVAMQIALTPWGAPVVADAAQIEQILMNLVVNARDAMPRGGELHILTRDEHIEFGSRRSARLRPGNYVALVVRDTGIGMDEQTQARIFEPFFTTKGPGEGTGLGLSTVYGIVEQLNGRVEVISAPGQGATFTVLLPRDDVARPAAAAAPPPPAPPAPRGVETILLVEDETLIRAALRHQLGALGYRVLDAANAEAALQVCDGGPAPDLVLTDIVLPGRNGPQLVAELRQRQPRLAALYMSAYPNDYLVRQGRLPAGEPSLEKPFSDEMLATSVRAALDARRREGA